MCHTQHVFTITTEHGFYQTEHGFLIGANTSSFHHNFVHFFVFLGYNENDFILCETFFVFFGINSTANFFYK